MVSIEGLNAGTETEPVLVKRRWWRQPQIKEGETPAEACRREATGELAFAVGGVGRDDDEVRVAAEEVLADDDFETDGRRLVDSAACWEAQAEDMRQLAGQINSGEIEVPEQMQRIYTELVASRPDLDIYIEPSPVEVVNMEDLSTPPTLLTNAHLREVSLVVDDPRSSQTSRFTMHQDPHRDNQVFGYEHTSGAVQDTAVWQNWNPAFDIEVELKDEASLPTAGRQHMDQVASLFRVSAENMAYHQTQAETSDTSPSAQGYQPPVIQQPASPGGTGPEIS